MLVNTKQSSNTMHGEELQKNTRYIVFKTLHLDGTKFAEIYGEDCMAMIGWV